MLVGSFIPKIDPFLLLLAGMVAAATLFPARGAAAAGFDVAADVAIMLLFFLHGAKLSRAAIVDGVAKWRLHLLVLASTYLIFPLTGLGLNSVDHHWMDPLLASGLLFLTLLPSTVQSSIAFTAIARGNVPAAVCSASLSNLLGIVLTPLLVSLLMHPAAGAGGGTSTWDSVKSILEQLLLPFLAGHLLRPWIGGFIDRNKKILNPVDRTSILLVVYSAFSAAVNNGIWTRVGVVDLGVLLVLCAVVLGVVMIANWAIARAAGLPREDAVVLFFCGSKKSLVSGVPMAGALFAPAQVGMVVLPLMIFHQLQLFLCAFLAARWGKEAGAPESATLGATPGLPQTAAEAADAAHTLGFAIPEPCMPGVVANLELLGRHAAILGQESGR
jgi:sodium/bile acid cotransporter 7